MLELPEAVAQLPSLRKLWLTHNALRALPDGLARLGRLQALLAPDNVFKELPPVRWGRRVATAACRWQVEAARL